jgi:hypothetical protein
MSFIHYRILKIFVIFSIEFYGIYNIKYHLINNLHYSKIHVELASNNTIFLKYKILITSNFII